MFILPPLHNYEKEKASVRFISPRHTDFQEIQEIHLGRLLLQGLHDIARLFQQDVPPSDLGFRCSSVDFSELIGFSQ